MKKITKAVIPAAGLGTRVLPATKAMPKGMLPLVDKPAIQYLVEEAVRSGITDILIIVSRNQDIIQDHFDRSPELEAKLAAPGKEKMLEECLGISDLANIFFVRQQQTLGLGHAVSMAKPFTGDDPFVVIYGDDVIWGEDPVCAQLIRAYEEFGRPVAGVSAVPWADVSRYCSLKTTPIHDNYFFVDDMIEKPKKGQEFSNYSILGRVLLTPEIYDILARTKPGAGGEIQLTDAMAEYARSACGISAVSPFPNGHCLCLPPGTLEARASIWNDCLDYSVSVRICKVIFSLESRKYFPVFCVFCTIRHSGLQKIKFVKLICFYRDSLLYYKKQIIRRFEDSLWLTKKRS